MHPTALALLKEFEPELSGFPASLPREFAKSLDALAVTLSAEDLRTWAEIGVGIAKQSLRSWETAAEFFRVSGDVLKLVPFAAFRRWAETGRELAEESSALSTAYFRAGPHGLDRLSVQQMREWAGMGKQLYKGTWKSSSLSAQFFDVTPGLLEQVSIAETRALVRFVDTLASKSYELAAACLGVAPRVLGSLDRSDRGPFLGFAGVIAETSWADARVYFEKGPGLLHHVQPEQRGRFLLLAGAVARKAGRQAYPFFGESATALGLLDQEAHQHLISLAETLAPFSGPASMEFLKSVPTVLDRIRYEDLEGWHAEGRRILSQSEEGGRAFFRLESGKGEEVIESLSSRVELSRVSEVLRMYCKALTGANVSIQSAAALAEKGVGWVSGERATTEGSAVYLPTIVEETHDKGENFAIYKVYSTHQAAHLEFMSFAFSYDRPGAILGNSRIGRLPAPPPNRPSDEVTAGARFIAPDTSDNVPDFAQRLPTSQGEGGENEATAAMRFDAPQGDGEADATPVRRAPLTDMERFFDLFADRKLASDLFTVVEDARVDYMIRREYGGIRKALNRVQRRELERRDPVERMPLRTALVENLIRASLDGMDMVRWPAALGATLGAAIAMMRQVQQDGALVEDTAEAVLRLYDLVMQVPNVLPDFPEEEWQGIDEEMISLDMLQAGEGEPGQESGGQPALNNMEQMEEQDYESPDAVDFRGDFKPELVQLLMRLREGMQSQGDAGQFAQLTPEQLQELLEKSVEIDISAFMEGELSETSGMFLNNLMKEAGTPASDGKQQQGPKDGQPADGGEEEGEPLKQEIEYFYYDEWDFRANDYRPGWCRIVQRTLEEGADDFFQKTLQSHSALVTQTRKQFELLRPELFRKIKRLYDGEDLDWDAVVTYAIERKARRTPDDKIYWRRNKIERDVAVAFLLDMSASTDEEINRRDRRNDDDEFDDDPRRYLTWWAQKKAREMQNPPKRIIDLEKEATVLLMEALETIGDTYGIYGFSGYGRDNVEYYVIKDLMESTNDRVKKRIDKIVPIRSTRMGPAIRHTISKLDQHDAKVKILFLVSDGRPQDHGYGRDRTEKEYAIHDTKMALNEAKRKGIVPFALTVDRAGHDYLKTMCEDIGYEVVADIEALPSRLPTLYRKLTE